MSAPESEFKTPSRDLDAPSPTSAVRGPMSLFVILHFACVFVVLSASFSPSALQRRLTQFFGFYTELLNLDLNFAPYYLTHATVDDVDHRLEYLPDEGDPEKDEDWRTLHFGWRGGDRHQRYQRLASVLSYFREDDDVTGRLARGAGEALAGRLQVRPRQLRCRKHFLMPWDRMSGRGAPNESDPNNRLYFQVVYSANVLLGPNDTVDIVKISSAQEVAPPTVIREPADGRNNRRTAP